MYQSDYILRLVAQPGAACAVCCSAWSTSHALLTAAFDTDPSRSAELLDALESELNDTDDPGDRDV
ncbi:MAG: hypothetical protein ACYC52_01960 [Coriobacteriia bacterium]